MEQEQDAKLDFNTAVKYLSLYLGVEEQECVDSLKRLTTRLFDKNTPTDAAKKIKQIVSYSVLYETYTKSRLPENPVNILFYCQKYDTLNDRDWWAILSKIIEEDNKIEKVRNFCLNLGVVYPIQYSPSTRQALNWLCDKAQSSGDTSPAFRKQAETLVYAYGGKVICGTFERDKEAFRIKKIPNWKSAYFFERIIFQTYDAEKIVKIKKQELQQTSPKLIVNLKK